jgi:hypothetical protein
MSLTTVAATVLAGGLILGGSAALATTSSSSSPSTPSTPSTLSTSSGAAASAAASAAAPSADASKRRPALTDEQWAKRLELACGRVRVHTDRVKLAQQRIGADASVKGSIARLQRRAERLQQAGQPELAELTRIRITIRRQVAEQLPQRLEALDAARKVCRG